MCKKGFKDNIVTAVRAIAKMVSERRVMTYAAAADYHLMIAIPPAVMLMISLVRYLPVTQEELTNTKHIDEVKECGSTVLCIDYAQNGVGSNSCGPKLDPRYALDEKNFTFTFSISPEMA